MTKTLASITVKEESDSLILVRRWFMSMLYGLAAFCVLWDISVAALYFGLMFLRPIPWVVMAFVALHGLFGLLLSYATLAGLLNSTRIRVGSGRLTTHHGPIPWRGQVDVDVANIADLFAAEKGGSRGSLYFSVYAVDHQGARRLLLRGLPSSEEAIFIVQRLQRHLGLSDNERFEGLLTEASTTAQPVGEALSMSVPTGNADIVFEPLRQPGTNSDLEG